jgi:hypothetical protein
MQQSNWYKQFNSFKLSHTSELRGNYNVYPVLHPLIPEELLQEHEHQITERRQYNSMTSVQS